LAQQSTAGGAPSSETPKETREHGDLLALVTVPAQALPADVRLVERVRTAPLIPATRNPDVLVDPQRIKPVAVFFGIRDQSALAPVRAAAVAVYQEREPANEIGVYGLSFCDRKAAREHFKRLVKGKDDPPFLRKGRLLLYIWKDDGASDSALEAIRHYFRTAKLQPARRSQPRRAPGRRSVRGRAVEGEKSGHR
jgi:hypothetical protein